MESNVKDHVESIKFIRTTMAWSLQRAHEFYMKSPADWENRLNIILNKSTDTAESKIEQCKEILKTMREEIISGDGTVEASHAVAICQIEKVLLPTD